MFLTTSKDSSAFLCDKVDNFTGCNIECLCQKILT